MQYEDFDIELEPSGEEGLFDIIARAPNGGARKGTLEIEESTQQLQALGFMALENARHGRSGADPAAEPPPSLRDFGYQLFDKLFSKDIGKLFYREIGRLESSSGSGMRIRLLFDLEDRRHAHSHTELMRLSSLPWELLWSLEHGYLCVNNAYPVVRCLNLPSAARPLNLNARPLRVLVAVCPTKTLKLDLEAERRAILKTWGKLSGIEVECFQPADRAELRRKVAREPEGRSRVPGGGFHVLHVMGHAGISDQGEVVLHLNDAETIAGSALADLVRGERQMQLAFLNACDTARTPSGRGLDPFAGIATALVCAGLPAVVAMQFPISDKAAIKFSETFYRGLAGDKKISAAVAEGRRAIKVDLDSMEWVTPVLFLRTVRARERVVAGTGQRRLPPPEVRRLLPYKPDRKKQWNAIWKGVKEISSSESRRPLIYLLYGGVEEKHQAFVDCVAEWLRAGGRNVPRSERGNDALLPVRLYWPMAGETRTISLEQWWQKVYGKVMPSSQSASRTVRGHVLEEREFPIKTAEGLSALSGAIGSQSHETAGVHTLLNVHLWLANRKLIREWLLSWADFPPLEESKRLVVVLSVEQLSKPRKTIWNFWRSELSNPQIEEAMGALADQATGVLCLNSLEPVELQDANRWVWEDLEPYHHAYDPHDLATDVTDLYRETDQIPMAELAKKLRRLLHKNRRVGSGSGLAPSARER